MVAIENRDALAEIGARWREAMLAGDFEAAWQQTDRLELPRRLAERRGDFTPGAQHLRWNGEPFTGRRVLVSCQHGLGDTIMFARYFPLLREQARSVTVKAQPMLLPLLAGMAGIDRLLNAWTAKPDPAHDVAIECMELAYAFRTTVETLPARVPYLPVGHLPAAPSLSLPNENKCRVGVVWAASDWDVSRSLAIEDLAPLAGVDGAVFYSLQQGTRAEEIAIAPIRMEPLSRETTEIVGAAGAILALDLIITVDTMAAHLAGALGRPVWLLLRRDADWRWARGQSRSAWYPTMRLFWQRTGGEWRAVVGEVAAALVDRIGSGARRE